jgi:hypothetical protein
MTVEEYCSQISKLYEETNNRDKCDTFIQFENQYDLDKSEIITKIKSIYGGMGSFSYMVLYKDGIIDIEANEKLGILR